MNTPTEGQFTIRRATRVGVKPLVVLYSESGCGKTYSALLLARGLAGPSGKVVMIETENGRGELYADVPVFCGYDVIRLSEPFSPSAYVGAIALAQSSGAAVCIVDSGSHEWEGTGGVLDMAGDNEQKSGKPGLHNWKTPKFEHAKFVAALMRATIPIIVCLRAKFKTKQRKDERGKTQIIKDDFTSPIQADDFIFEATCHGEIMPNHDLRLTKWSHPGLKACFAEGPITIQTGEALARWCAAPSASGPLPPEGMADIKTMKRKLWDATRQIHGCPEGEKDKATQRAAAQRLSQWLIDESVISDTETWDTLTVERLPDVIDKATFKLNNPPTP